MRTVSVARSDPVGYVLRGFWGLLGCELELLLLLLLLPLGFGVEHAFLLLVFYHFRL